MRTAAVAWLLAPLLCALGCDAVGAALVDETARGEGLPRIRCQPPPACEPPDAGPAVMPRPLLPVDMEQCRRDRELPCVPEDAGAAEGLPEGSEAPGEQPDAGAGVPCGPPPTEQCGLVVVENTGGDTAASTTFSEPVWSGVDVVARSEQPFEVVIENGWLFDVSVTLHGPIALRIRAAELVQDLRVQTADDAAGEARLVIEDSAATLIAAGEPDHAFAGSMDVLRSELSDVQIVASDLQLESGKLLGGLVLVDDVNGIDTELADLELSFDQALLAAFSLRRTRITQCGALTLIEGTARDVQLPPCETRPARIYSTSVVRGAFDGRAEADRSNFTGVTLGLQSPTEITTFSSHFSAVAFCEHADAFVLASVSSVRCSSCPDGTPDRSDEPPDDESEAQRRLPADLTGRPPELVCFVPSPSYGAGEDTPTSGNFCELPDPPPVCDEPHPVRRRPLPEPF